MEDNNPEILALRLAASQSTGRSDNHHIPDDTSPPSQASPPASKKTPFPANSDSDESNVTSNDSEDYEKDPWHCICGKRGHDYQDVRASVHCDGCCRWVHRGCLGLSFFADDEVFHCYDCVPRHDPKEYEDLLRGRDKGEKAWLRNMLEYEIKGTWNHDQVKWFWTLWMRCTEDNIRAMKEGRLLSGRQLKGRVSEWYLGHMEKYVGALLRRLDDAEVQSLYGSMTNATGERSRLYKALLEAGERQKQAGWEGWSEEIDFLASLFGWKKKLGQE